MFLESRKVSLILPVYNVESYLERAVNSILEQEMTDYEVIFVNDGSTDGSREILEQMVLKNKSFKLINKKNEGSGIARNIGLKHAVGDYVYFMDPDDEIEKNLLKDNYDIISTYDADAIMFGYKEINLHKQLEKNFVNEADKLLENNFEIISELPKISQKNSIHAVWNKLYKREFLIKNKIYFSDLSTGQDAEFNWRLFDIINVLVVNSNIYYNYYKNRIGSARTTYNEQSFNNEIKILNTAEQLILKNNVEELYRNLLNEYKINILVSEIINLSKKKKINIKHELYEKNLYKEVCKLPLRSINNKNMKIRLFLLKFRMYKVFHFIYKIQNK